MLKTKLADILNYEGLRLAKGLYTSIEKHGREKFESFMEGELKPNARLLTPSLIYLLMVAAQETLQETLQAEKKERFVPVREKGMRKKIEDASKQHEDVAKINADLLRKPASEGWKLDVRAKYIANKTGYKESYVRRLIATPRNTNQT